MLQGWVWCGPYCIRGGAGWLGGLVGGEGCVGVGWGLALVTGRRARAVGGRGGRGVGRRARVVGWLWFRRGLVVVGCGRFGMLVVVGWRRLCRLVVVGCWLFGLTVLGVLGVLGLVLVLVLGAAAGPPHLVTHVVVRPQEELVHTALVGLNLRRLPVEQRPRGVSI